MYPPVPFRLNQFKQIGGWFDKNLPPLFAWLCKAFLRGLEDKYIEAKAKAAVEAALASEELLEAFPESSVDKPTTQVIESDVQGLDEIRITAPWIYNNSKQN